MEYFRRAGNAIRWNVRNGQTHKDDIEMTGLMASDIIGYGVQQNGNVFFSRYCIFPTLRTIPNNTHASLRKELNPASFPKLLADGTEETEIPVSFTFDGILTAKTKTPNFSVTREFYPAANARATVERTTVKNRTDHPVHLTLSTPETVLDEEVRGTKGVYLLEVIHDPVDRILQPGESAVFALFCTGRIANEAPMNLSADRERAARKKRIRKLTETVVLKTDDPELDLMFRFACLRAGESIVRTITGNLHAPGGKNFYAATWCNDEVEYAGPWFACTGDPICINASMNAYREYTAFMSDSYYRIPSSIIAEGLDIWEDAGDRGDAAMYLFGASLFALTLANSAVTKKLWKPIRWCAEYCRRMTTPEGVIRSDSDELEGRFPTDGYANLSTSCLCYGGLNLAAKIAEEQNEPALAEDYRNRAKKLADAIETYFGEELHGFHTYRYTKGHNTLRSWICLPLCVGIQKRKEDTLNALFSPYLWTKNGMLSCEKGEENKNDTVWDRSTLFAFKGSFLADRIDPTWDSLKNYIRARLFGDRVPYAVEAYPENAMRHLSAESALFCRIFTEGLLKLSPEGNAKYSLTPRLPGQLTHFELSGLYLAGHRITVRMERGKPAQIFRDGKLLTESPLGKSVTIDLK